MDFLPCLCNTNGMPVIDEGNVTSVLCQQRIVETILDACL